MRYVIMANGRGRRWGNYLGKSKHLIEIEGETLLQRTTRLVHEIDLTAEVYISSSSPANEAAGATRHVPLHGEHELNRFCYELIAPHTCFLYGDTFYTKKALETIIATPADPIMFFGNDRSIVAVKTTDETYFKSLLDTLFHKIETGEIDDAKGWDLHKMACDDALDAGKAIPFVHMDDITQDFNSPDDYLRFSHENAG